MYLVCLIAKRRGTSNEDIDTRVAIEKQEIIYFNSHTWNENIRQGSKK